MAENFYRGLRLMENGRVQDAEPFLRKAVEENPEDPGTYFLLACCLGANPKGCREALQVIDEALRLAPDQAPFHVQKARILLVLEKSREAAKEVQVARELDPSSVDPFVIEGAIFLMQGKPRDAETAARNALALDPENEAAANQLAHALRLQGRMIENAEQVQNMLARHPESPRNHATAGWSALQEGKVRVAEQHFLESLRLDPNDPNAREGLLQAFRGRSALYRFYLRYCFWMQQLNRTSRIAVIIGLLVVMRLAREVFVGRFAPIAIAVVALYFLFVLWIWVARGVGNFFLMFDRFARHALNRNEKIEACTVGGGVLIGLCLFGISIIFDLGWLMFLGLTLIGAAFPMSMVFTNPSRKGQLVFGAMSAGVYAAGGYCAARLLLTPALPINEITGVFSFAMILTLLTTWIANIPALRRA